MSKGRTDLPQNGNAKDHDGTENAAYVHDINLEEGSAANGNHAQVGSKGAAYPPEKSPDVASSSDALTCGWFGCRPRWMRCLSTARWMLVALCLGAFFEALFINGLLPSSLPSIERRFQISSRKSGLMFSVFDIVTIIIVLFFVHFAGRSNKLRLTSIGVALLAIGAFVFSLPHFITEPYSYVSSNQSLTCEPAAPSAMGDECVASESVTYLGNLYYIFVLGLVIAAIGSLPLYTLGMATLDESVSNESFGLYFGCLLAVLILGPGFGFFLAGSFLNTFTELEVPEGVELSPTDPGWVGAWWLGCIASGFLLLISAVPLSLFPRELETTAQIRAEKENQAHQNAGSIETARPDFGRKPVDFLLALRYLVVNPTFICTCLGSVADTLLANGLGAFLPKFFQNQFGITPSLTNVLIGIAVVIGGIIGSFVGGIIMRRHKLKVAGLLKVIICCHGVSALLYFSLQLQCPQAQVGGVTINYDGSELTSDQQVNLTRACNSDCACSTDLYFPVCDETSAIEYFSPCHAGCTTDYGDGYYGDCSCLSESTSNSSLIVTAGSCPTVKCEYPHFIFTAVLVVLTIISYAAIVINYNVYLRCVPESQRSMSLGAFSFLTRLFGAVPGPIVFGAIIDGVCLLWQETCGERGSCWIYDRASFGIRVTILAVVLKFVGCGFNVLALLLYKPAVENDDEGLKTNMENKYASGVVVKNEENSDTKM